MQKKSKAVSIKPGTGNTLKVMLRIAWKKKPILFLVFGLALIVEVVHTLLPVILPKYIIEFLMTIVQGTPYEAVKEKLLWTVGLLIGSDFLCNIMLNILNAVKVSYAELFNRYLEQDISKHAMAMDFEHTEDPDALDQLNKAKEGITWYSGGVVNILNDFYNIILNICILFCGSILVIKGCPWLIVIQMAGLVFIAYFNFRNNEIQVKSFQELSRLNRRFGYYFYQVANFSFGKDIRLYDSVDMFSTRGQEENNKMYHVWKKQALGTMKNNQYVNIVNTFRDSISYFYLGFLALMKRITVGDFTMYVSAASTFYWAMYRVVTNVQEVTKHCSYIAEYLVFMEYPAVMPKGNMPVPQQAHTIEFKDVSFKYPRSEEYVLHHVNLTLHPGEHLSIVGLNGAGKTTFIKLLCRLYDVTEGEILLDGRNIKEYSDAEYRKVFAPVFQDFQLFAFSLKENVALDKSDSVSEEEIQRALQLSGVYEEAVKLEQGIDTIIYKSFDEKGTDLSGGQRQKVAISRALYKNAPVVILDEPTAALDPVAEYEIYKKFNDLVGGKTAIYISHRLSSCKFCDKIAVFAEDHIKEYGTHSELIEKKDGIYAEMFAAQAQYYV